MQRCSTRSSGRADLDKDGRISGQEAVGFFQGAGLLQITLAKLWASREHVRFETRSVRARHHGDSTTRTRAAISVLRGGSREQHSDGRIGQEVRPAVQGSGRSEFAAASRGGSVPRYPGGN